MRLLRAATLLAVGGYAASASPALRVLRVSPSGDASPAAVVTVTFDRPVAGSLDRTVDPRTIFGIEPVTDGRLEWRDPVTIRFTPASPLKPGSSYTVTIGNSFAAMDGARLAEPYRFTFSVGGPRVLTGLPVNGENHPLFLTPDTRFRIVFSAPLELAGSGAVAYLDFARTCRTPGVIRLKPTDQRAIGAKDPWEFRDAGGYQRDRAADPLRRIVEFVPERALPLDCAGELVVASSIDPEGTSPFLKWGFHTYGPLSIVKASCSGGRYCPAGGVDLRFSTPVRGAELLRRVRIYPQVPFTISDTSEESAQWNLEATLKPNTGYAVVVDTALRDVFGQPLGGNPASGFTTTGYAPLVEYAYGRMTIERVGFHTLAVKYVNVDTLDVAIGTVPDSLEAGVLQYTRWVGRDSTIAAVMATADHRKIPVSAPRDRVRIFGLKLPVFNASRPRAPTLQVVKVTSPGLDSMTRAAIPYAIVQVTDLGVHARIGADEGVVWVTGASDGRPRADAAVTLFDWQGRARATARTDQEGVARLSRFRVPPAADDQENRYRGFEGYIAAVYGTDRAVTAISQYDADLSPWRFNVRSAWGDRRFPLAGAVFTERGIYRPGEPLYAKAIVRDGPLGALRVPATGDSLHWIFTDREAGILKEATTRLSPFGTASQTITLPPTLPLGEYRVRIQKQREGRWIDIGSAGYRIAEYRPPEFLVDLAADSGTRLPGDTLSALVQARYLFGAPMGRAALSWTARQSSMGYWDLLIPDTEGYFIGDNGSWWEDDQERGPAVQVTGSGTDTLDASGQRRIASVLTAPPRGRPAVATLEATVTDVNRQTVSTSVTSIVHPASFYIGAKPLGTSYFWSSGVAQRIALIAVRPDGRRVTGVAIGGAVVRREWHQVHRDRAGYAETVGEWVSDTVARCRLVSRTDPVDCEFTPAAGGSYIASFRAVDEAGREVVTSVYRWVTGKEWVPWSDETQFKMDVIPDRNRYSVGDTATVLFASPFTDAEAWITVEREGLLEQRRLRLTSGTTTLKFPITEMYAPNAFVSIIVARGRSAAPGPLDDPGRPTIRVGYAELRVTPEVKRLAVVLEPLAKEYRPGDTAKVRIRVKDIRGAGQRSEVTLWAVDEGVLALTGYRTPDPIDLLYQPRGLGMRLASNLTTVAPQVPEGEKGGRAPGGGGGLGESEVLRSRFTTTAFFLGSVVTDSTGVVIARAKLPDNLTTFRLMGVAVTAGDRYGKGQSSLLVTRPLLARPALPRFVRQGDRFTAGVVVNQRVGGTPTVRVSAEAIGAQLGGSATQSAMLEAGRGREVRFDFRQPGEGRPGGADSATFRFQVTGAGASDAVQQRLAVQPAFRPRAYTIAGVLADTATADFSLPEGIDPDRSRLELSLGTSPLGIVRAMQYELMVYPYWCTEQVSSAAAPIIALYRAQLALGAPLMKGEPKREIEKAVGVISSRQRPDGGIGYWGSGDWTTPWLSALAGITLLDARAAGVAVSDTVLARLGDYLSASLHNPVPIRAPVIGWYDQLKIRLADQVAAADYLSRLRRPDLAAENELLRVAPQLAWEDKARLAEVLSRRGATRAARALLDPVWSTVRVEGRRAIVPDSAVPSYHYFGSRIRPVGRLLTATLAVDSSHALIGPLVETLVQQQRATGLDWWNTQDYAATISALAAFSLRQKAASGRGFRVTGGGRVLFAATAGSRLPGDSSVALSGLLENPSGEKRRLRLAIAATAGGTPIYYYLTVREVPLQRPLNPDEAGIQVERWYERFDDPRPIIDAREGEIVRVRLRVTVPADRQFVVLDDALPAGLEAIDLSLRTAGGLPGPGAGRAANDYLANANAGEGDEGDSGEGSDEDRWYYGSWDSGWWSPFDHKELRDDRVVYFATVLWKGTYTATYLARATTPGTFVRPPAQAEEMYNPAVRGRSDGGVFTVTPKQVPDAR